MCPGSPAPGAGYLGQVECFYIDRESGLRPKLEAC